MPPITFILLLVLVMQALIMFISVISGVLYVHENEKDATPFFYNAFYGTAVTAFINLLVIVGSLKH